MITSYSEAMTSDGLDFTKDLPDVNRRTISGTFDAVEHASGK